jgi:hypothetical protein
MRTAHCISRFCGKQFDSAIQETRDTTTLRSFWSRYCPACRTLGNAGTPVIVAQPRAKDEPRMSCDQCNMLSINGVACHETGCPNTKSRWDEESGEWIRQRKCFDCGCTADAEDPCCSEPTEDEPMEDETEEN